MYVLSIVKLASSEVKTVACCLQTGVSEGE